MSFALIYFCPTFQAFAYSDIACCTKPSCSKRAGTAVFADTHSMNPSFGHIPAPRASANSSQYFSMQFLAFTEPAAGSPPAGMQLRHAGSARPGRYPLVFLQSSSQVGMACANCDATWRLRARSWSIEPASTWAQRNAPITMRESIFVTQYCSLLANKQIFNF